MGDRRRRAQQGASLLELLAVITIMGLLVGATATGLQPTSSDLQDSEILLEGFFRASRARAMSTTSAVRVSPAHAGRLVTEFAAGCSDTTWSAESLALDLPDSVRLQSTGWSVCFSSRGVADQNLTVSLEGSSGRVGQVEITLGGGARVVP